MTVDFNRRKSNEESVLSIVTDSKLLNNILDITELSNLLILNSF